MKNKQKDICCSPKITSHSCDLPLCAIKSFSQSPNDEIFWTFDRIEPRYKLTTLWGLVSIYAAHTKNGWNCHMTIALHQHIPLLQAEFHTKICFWKGCWLRYLLFRDLAGLWFSLSWKAHQFSWSSLSAWISLRFQPLSILTYI